MSAKAEIGWRRVDEDGRRFQVYARRVGKEWRFYERQARYDEWRQVTQPPLADWLALLEAVRRRVPRRLVPPAELDRLRRQVQALFPEAVLES